MQIPGIFGTRADLLMDIILITVVCIPAILSYSMRMARNRNYKTHRNIQVVTFLVVLTAVVLFEINIQKQGGSGALVAGSPFAENRSFLFLLYVHIAISICTFGLWGLLLLYSGAVYKKEKLPGVASEIHKRIGFIIFMGSTATALSGIFVYLFAFVTK